MAPFDHIRSATYPPKTNPIIQKIEEELKKLSKSEASSTSTTQTICIGLTGLARLYRCVDNVLSMPLLSQRTLSLSLTKHGHFLVEGSAKLIEICECSKQMLSKLLDAVQAVECRSDSEAQISSYFSLRKEVTKTAKSHALQLRQVEESLANANDICEDFEVIKVLRCVSIINISVFESMLRLLSMPLTSSWKIKSSNKFHLISKLLVTKRNKSVISEGTNSKSGNELRDVDVALHGFYGDRFDHDIAKKRLEDLEVALRGIDDGFKQISKQLSRTRASLMNMISV